MSTFITDRKDIIAQIPDKVVKLDRSARINDIIQANYGVACRPLTYKLLSDLKRLQISVPAILHMINLNNKSKKGRAEDIYTVTFHSDRICDSDDPPFAK